MKQEHTSNNTLSDLIRSQGKALCVSGHSLADGATVCPEDVFLGLVINMSVAPRNRIHFSLFAVNNSFKICYF